MGLTSSDRKPCGCSQKKVKKAATLRSPPVMPSGIFLAGHSAQGHLRLVHTDTRTLQQSDLSGLLVGVGRLDGLHVSNDVNASASREVSLLEQTHQSVVVGEGEDHSTVVILHVLDDLDSQEFLSVTSHDFSVEHSSLDNAAVEARVVGRQLLRSSNDSGSGGVGSSHVEVAHYVVGLRKRPFRDTKRKRTRRGP